MSSSSPSASSMVCTPTPVRPSQGKQLPNGSPSNPPEAVATTKKSSTRIVVPAITAARALGKSTVITPKAGTREKEKTGRWSEEEHSVFLEGLQLHGKQWKVIAGMIGTRTVVQVRTHAQKYFQRIERANKPPAPKRKMSLPSSLPSRKKLKGGSPKGKKLQRAASISLVQPAVAASPTPLQHNELPTYPSYVSNTSSMSSDTQWSTSPSGVTETHDQFDIFDTIASAGKEATPEDMFDFKELGQDPLEWLVEAEPSILPESSLPVFPDLSTTPTPSTLTIGATIGGGHNHNYPSVDSHDYSTENHMVDDSHSSASAESYVNENILNSIVDPNVTVQSLFLLPEE